MNQHINIIELETLNDLMSFDVNTGRIISFRSKFAPEQEFIRTDEKTPVFIIQYLDENSKFRQIKSNSPCETVITENTLIFTYTNVGDRKLDVTIKIHASTSEPFSRWSLAFTNNDDLLITDIQYPFIIVPYELSGEPGTESLLRPFSVGQLIKAPQPHDFEPDNPHAWQFTPENGNFKHYTGRTFAQLLAYYNDRAGLYISCSDSSGKIKQIKPVHNSLGIRLGFSHVGDWLGHGEKKLEYGIVMTSFKGDWYTAAELYRNWSLDQEWAKTPLFKRKDIPEWLLDSPPHVLIRIQGELDEGPADENREFLPYAKIIPLLDNISKEVELPLLPVVMSWERPGPWVYPDCFPPAGGEESFKEFTKLSGQKGWHVGSYCNGTRWVTGHYWSGYDGEDYFMENGGDKTVCRTHTQELWRQEWDQTWRPSYPGCIYVEKTREIAGNFVNKLIDMGVDWIQFLDQNNGVSVFPCFARDHGHEPVPGKWMTENMVYLLNNIHRLADEKRNENNGNREIVFSVEGTCNEYFIPQVHICDVRISPPGHTGEEKWLVPLYQYLYHEFILMQGGFGLAPEPYHMVIKNAYNFVVGEIPGGVLKTDGKFQNRDTSNWAPWKQDVGSNEDSIRMLKAASLLRKGIGRDYLVFGRMQRPSDISGIKIVNWQENSRAHNIPAIFHAAWTTQDGRFGIAAANWTGQSQNIVVNDIRLGSSVRISVAADTIRSFIKESDAAEYELNIPPLCCLVVEEKSC